jgi:hypothetical protein
MDWMFIFAYFIYVIIVKSLTKDPKLRLREIVYFLLTGLVIAVLAQLWFHEMFLVFVIPKTLFLFFYLYKMESYTVKKAMILICVANVIVTILEIIIMFAFAPIMDLMVDSTLLQMTLFMLAPYGVFMASAALAAMLFAKATKQLRAVINQNKWLQNVLLALGTIIYVADTVLILFTRAEGDYNYNLQEMFGADDFLGTAFAQGVFIGLIALIIFVGIIIFVQLLKSKYNKQLRQQEEENLKTYLTEIEHQYTAMRKFGHDYQNILLSIDSFIREKDYAGLEEYYKSKIKIASEVIAKNSFTLEPLSKIETRELKSILAVKLITAQNMGVDVSFEANEVISSTFVDSIALVRTLSIILDNAIEELERANHGKLSVACIKEKDKINIIVQNTRCPDASKPNEHLGEITEPIPNIILKTTAEKEQLTQILTIM